MFGINLGGNKNKTKTTETKTTAFSNTTNPIVPDWVAGPVQSAAGQIGDLAGANPYQFVAPANGLQQQAAAGAGALTGMGWNFDQAADLTRGVAQAAPNTYDPTYGVARSYGAATGGSTNAQSASVLDNLDAYMSPYRRDVVDAALADYDVSAGQTRAQQDLDLAGSGAFGGSGAALTRSMTEDALVRGRASTSANLLDQMFQRGTALSSADADRRQQVSLANAGAANQFGLANLEAVNAARQFNAGAQNQFGLANAAAANQAAQFNATARDQQLQRQLEAANGLVGLSTAYEQNQRANIATQADMGGRMRDIQQQFRQAPLSHANQIVAMLQGLPLNLFTGEQKTGTESSTGNSTVKSKGVSVDLSYKDQ